MAKEFLSEQIQKAEEIVKSGKSPFLKINELGAMSDNIGLLATHDKLRAPQETDILQKKLDKLIAELSETLPS